ncbi:hypothetical protein A9F13_02g04433 [Clavispora lusitaniae]|uniref:Uncharacterized protein n=1 Tax=Clavispora lusitaniae TaxID=36911 RepID=A0AA91T3N6_CLALS|nr:hypothetical protein A9F13_02g04433 [Clavispora lusitaniae]
MVDLLDALAKLSSDSDSDSDEPFHDAETFSDRSGEERHILQSPIYPSGPNSTNTSQKGSPSPVVKGGGPRADEDIVIPAVFLTQGAKNSRLLKQSAEIARQLEAEKQRAAAERASLYKKRQAILTELNDNGSGFTYSLKTDLDLVDSYVESTYANHHSVYLARHFYCFRDQQMSSEHEPALDFLFRMGDLRALPETLALHSISISRLVRYAVNNIQNETHLDLVTANVEKEMMEQLEGKSNAGIEEADERKTEERKTEERKTEVEHNGEEEKGQAWSLEDAMAQLGANMSTNLTLKYVHYYRSTSALIFKVAMVLLYFSAHTDLSLSIRAFIVSVSDFALNKEERRTLVARVVGPVFRALVARARLSGMSDESICANVCSELASIRCYVYGEKKRVMQKECELQYAFLDNLVASGAEAKVASLLVSAFLAQSNGLGLLTEEPPNSESRDIINKNAQTTMEEHKLSETSVTPLPECSSVETADVLASTIPVASLTRTLTSIERTKVQPHLSGQIFANLYRAQLCAALVVRLLHSALASEFQLHPKHQWRALHRQVLATKDSLQQAVGAVSYMPIEETPDKVTLSKALGETYNALDQMSMVLDKNAVFFRADLFYDSPS